MFIVRNTRRGTVLRISLYSKVDHRLVTMVVGACDNFWGHFVNSISFGTSPLYSSYSLDQGPGTPTIQGLDSPPTSLPRVTVTGYRTDSFDGNDGAIFQTLFQSPFDMASSGEGIYTDHQGPEPPDNTEGYDPDEVVQNSSFYQQLSTEAKEALLSSPTLVAQLAAFLQSGGVIQFDNVPSGQTGQFLAGLNKITIDNSVLEALNSGDSYAIETFLSSTAHELGHAMLNHAGYVFDTTSRQAYIDSGLRSEAYAVLNAMLALHEAKNAGQANFTLMTGGNSGGTYEALYWAFVGDGNLSGMLDAIEAHMRADPNGYPKVYGDAYDAQH